MADLNEDINKALAIYIGMGITSYPKEDGSRLILAFGPQLAQELEMQAKQLLEELNQLKPDWSVHSLVGASKWASGELRKQHPELDGNGAAALEWAFSWWWR